MVSFCFKRYLWRLERIVWRKGKLDSKEASIVRGVSLRKMRRNVLRTTYGSFDDAAPLEQIFFYQFHSGPLERLHRKLGKFLHQESNISKRKATDLLQTFTSHRCYENTESGI